MVACELGKAHSGDSNGSRFRLVGEREVERGRESEKWMEQRHCLTLHSPSAQLAGPTLAYNRHALVGH